MTDVITCRHCGRRIRLTETQSITGPYWCDNDGFMTCVKAGYDHAFVLHEPMPAGLVGGPKEAA